VTVAQYATIMMLTEIHSLDWFKIVSVPDSFAVMCSDIDRNP